MSTFVKLFAAATGTVQTLTGLSASAATQATIVAAAAVVVATIALALRQSTPQKNLPPAVKSRIPLVGNMVEFGRNPLAFLQRAQREYGECFRFSLLGKPIVFFMGPEGNNFVFNAKLADASAEEAYRNLTVPVFGREVVYDVPNAVLMEQKKFVKDALTVDAFRAYVPMIVEETQAYFAARLPKGGTIDILRAMAELTILTASRCLLGKEIRAQLDAKVAQLYWDLDGGFTPLNFVYPYFPIPSTWRRDRAQREMAATFGAIMRERRARNDLYDNTDVLQTLMTSQYKDGSHMSDRAVANLLIALLMAGQHTSSTTGTWALQFLAHNSAVQRELLAEQQAYYAARDEKITADEPVAQLPELDYDAIRAFKEHDLVVKETLRVRPPIVVVMRKAIRDLSYMGLEIPRGHYIAVSPAVSQLDAQKYPEPEKWDPARHRAADAAPLASSSEWNYSRLDVAEKSAKSYYLPFGAGRHRCIGEAFAYVQLKTILATILRTYSLEPARDSTGAPLPLPPRNFSTMVVMPEKPCLLSLRPRF